MKGQLDKQQEKARQAQALTTTATTVEGQQSNRDSIQITEDDDELNSDQDERITYWTRQQLEKRSRELNLVQNNGHSITIHNQMNYGLKRLSGVEEFSMSDVYSEARSPHSKSHSTTSGSQVTVRSSPVVLDKLVVCRHCHKNCHQKNSNHNDNLSILENEKNQNQNQMIHCNTTTSTPTSSSSSSSSCQPIYNINTNNKPTTFNEQSSHMTSPLLCNSLKVQHSQSSPNRCPKVNGGGIEDNNSRTSSVISITSSIKTRPRHSRPSDISPTSLSLSKVVNTVNADENRSELNRVDNANNDNTISDNLTSNNNLIDITATSTKTANNQQSQSQDQTNNIAETSRTDSNDAKVAYKPLEMNDISTQQKLKRNNQTVMNGHYAESSIAKEISKQYHQHVQHHQSLVESTAITGYYYNDIPKAQRAQELKEVECTNENILINNQQQVLTTVTLTEIATIVRNDTNKNIPPKPNRSNKLLNEMAMATSTSTSTSTSSSSTLLSQQHEQKLQQNNNNNNRNNRLMSCHCPCRPNDFVNNTISPDKIEHKTCKLLEMATKKSSPLSVSTSSSSSLPLTLSLSLSHITKKQSKYNANILNDDSNNHIDDDDDDDDNDDDDDDDDGDNVYVKCKCICGSNHRKLFNEVKHKEVIQNIKAEVMRQPQLEMQLQQEYHEEDVKEEEDNVDMVNTENDLSLMLIGLAQCTTPAAKLLNIKTPTTPLPTPTSIITTTMANNNNNNNNNNSNNNNNTKDSHSNNADIEKVEHVPSISVVPPTPDTVLTKTLISVWDNTGGINVDGIDDVTDDDGRIHVNNISTNLLISHMPIRQVSVENIPEDAYDNESPLDEESPPYSPINGIGTSDGGGGGLKRYGTMSSLEKLAKDEHNYPLSDFIIENRNDNYTDNYANHNYKTEGDDNEDDDDNDNELMIKAKADNIELEHEIRVVTKHLLNGDHDDSHDDNSDDYDDNVANKNDNGNSHKDAAWTSRASTYVTGKMSFFEESRAFIDKYLGRWNQDYTTTNIGATGSNLIAVGVPGSNSETDEQTVDECTSGATSGEDVWGTPTSGGDMDDQHLNNSENTQSSPTKSSNSLNDDDDTELMMDELLMAPPMTANTIRGLLPRRRLEPLFEEETESDEEKTQQESEDLKQGETTTNGRYLEDSESGNSSAEEAANEADYDDEDEDEDEEDLISTEDRIQPNLQMNWAGPRPLRKPTLEDHQLPTTMLTASSCEYLLEPRLIPMTNTEEHKKSLTTTPIVTTTSLTATTTIVTTQNVPAMTTVSPSRLATSITATSMNATTKSNKKDENYTKEIQQQQQMAAMTTATTAKTRVKQAKFIPPPPPPRRLLLNQTNLKPSGKLPQAPIKPPRSGISADIGYTGDVTKSNVRTNNIHATSSKIRSVCNIKTTAINVISNSPVSAKPITPSATIIETSMLNANHDENSTSTLLTTHSMMITKEKTLQTQIETPLTLPQVPPPNSNSNTEKIKNTKIVDSANKSKENQMLIRLSNGAHIPPAGSGLSPRLEMRLALNQDILDDEDLISYDPGPNLITILGHDLSTFHRLTSRELLQRTMTNRVQPKEKVINYPQHQRNSKMDTPTVNRRSLQQQTKIIPSSATNSNNSIIPPDGRIVHSVGSDRADGVPQHWQANQNTWNNFAFAALNRDVNANDAVNYKSKDEQKLSDLEILARREKIYCMSQLRSGSPVKTATPSKILRKVTMNDNNLSNNPSIITTNVATGAAAATATASPASTATPKTLSMVKEVIENTNKEFKVHGLKTYENEAIALLDTTKKSDKLINFFRRRNSEMSSLTNCSQMSLNASPLSPRKDNDKSSLNRRLWKHLTKRRRAHSVSEIAAS